MPIPAGPVHPSSSRHRWGPYALLTIALVADAGETIAPRTLELQAPLTTTITADRRQSRPQRLEAVVVVPADAPADLGAGAFVSDRHGLWFRSTRTVALPPGRHQLSFDLDAQASLIGEPHRAAWTPSAHALMTRAGLFLWSQQASRAVLRIERLEVVAEPPQQAPPPSITGHLRDLHLDGHDAVAGVVRCRTGERWTMRTRPDPFPAEPYRDDLVLELTVTGPDGREQRVAGFHRQPMAIQDRGDGEVCTPTAAAWYEVRYRPGLPGRYRLRLGATWAGQAEPLVTDLPDLLVEGGPWDDYVRVDAQDPRFFATGGRIGAGRFHWPIGLNLHSVWDTLSHENFATVLTPDRLLHAYEAYLRRFAAAGGTAVEIWLSSWSLSLEWRGDWKGFHGIGRYNEENAERIERILDLACGLGIRVNLVVNNHGQASMSEDREWQDNPYNTALGGPLRHAGQYFTDPQALAGQERYRRYLVARWADHPGVLGWKLWSEEDLTEGRQNLRRWHRDAAARWDALDIYGHPRTTHWCPDYRNVDREVARQPGLGYLCIDAYHPRGTLLAQLVWDSVLARDGLGRLGKPILITEYGGDCKTCPEPQLVAELGTSAWAALVSGNAGSPMAWWSEWVDQHDHWLPYRAIAAFIAGEDLRGAGRPTIVATSGGSDALWSRAWVRPGRMLGYCLVRDWGATGRKRPVQQGVLVQVGEQVAAGALVVEWWDADRGQRLAREHLDHPGGALQLRAPGFLNHVAYKLIRQRADTAERSAAER